MKHSASRQLYAYWDRIRGERAAPERSEIEPGQIRHLLADSLILEIEPAGGARLRLAGTRVCALFGRELKGLPFAGLWDASAAQTAPEAGRIVETVASETVGVVAGLRGVTAAGEVLDLELLLLPLRHRGRTQARALGALSPATMPAWLGLRPLARLDTVSLRILRGAAALPSPANDPAPVRRRHLLVLPGGRA